MFVDDCPYSERGLGGFRCLSAIGWLFTIVFTYTGFALLIAGEPCPPFECFTNLHFRSLYSRKFKIHII